MMYYKRTRGTTKLCQIIWYILSTGLVHSPQDQLSMYQTINDLLNVSGPSLSIGLQITLSKIGACYPYSSINLQPTLIQAIKLHCHCLFGTIFLGFLILIICQYPIFMLSMVYIVKMPSTLNYKSEFHTLELHLQNILPLFLNVNQMRPEEEGIYPAWVWEYLQYLTVPWDGLKYLT